MIYTTLWMTVHDFIIFTLQKLFPNHLHGRFHEFLDTPLFPHCLLPCFPKPEKEFKKKSNKILNLYVNNQHLKGEIICETYKHVKRKTIYFKVLKKNQKIIEILFQREP